MTDCQATLLSLLSKALFNRTAIISEAKWHELLHEAKYQSVQLLVYEALDQSMMPKEDGKLWNDYAMASIASNIRINHNHSSLHEWLSAAGIPYVILKGCASASYYPVPDYRAMGDVDFLVPIEDLKRAGKVLEAHGLKPWEEEHISHIVYRAAGMHYEMHFDLAGTPNGEAGKLMQEYMADVFEKASIHPVGSGEAVLPSPFHHGLILLLHTCHHMTGEGIGLRHLCDWAAFEDNFSDKEFQVLYEEKLKAIGLWKFAQVLTRVSIKYLGAEDRKWAICDDQLADALMEDILAGGNFGQKDHNRSVQTMLISDRGKDGIGRSNMLSQFIQSTNKIIYQHWPHAKKNKLLLSFGWLYFGARRIIRELTGKRRKTDLKQTVSGATNRRNLYQQLRLYEEEVI